MVTAHHRTAPGPVLRCAPMATARKRPASKPTKSRAPARPPAAAARGRRGRRAARRGGGALPGGRAARSQRRPDVRHRRRAAAGRRLPAPRRSSLCVRAERASPAGEPRGRARGGGARWRRRRAAWARWPRPWWPRTTAGRNRCCGFPRAEDYEPLTDPLREFARVAPLLAETLARGGEGGDAPAGHGPEGARRRGDAAPAAGDGFG